MESLGIVDSHYVTSGDQVASNSYNKGTPQLPAALSLADFSTPGFRSLHTYEDLLDALRAMSINAVHVVGPLTEHRFIARGAQFSVYRDFITCWVSDQPRDLLEVAVKRCHFQTLHNERLDLSADAARKQVHDIYLEILALQHPELRAHRNIVKMLGLSDEENWEPEPLLVLELATADLSSFLESSIEDKGWLIKHYLCLDMGNGLDALHQNGIIHGDFKPANILIFQNDGCDVPFIAKLADFGFSTTEAQNISDNRIHVAGWTFGWHAPEIVRHVDKKTPISSEDYCKADIYSLGLVVWSVFCFNGAMPPRSVEPDTPSVAGDAIQTVSGIPALLRKTLSGALRSLLRHSPSERPSVIGGLLQDDCHSSQTWRADCRSGELQDMTNPNDTLVPLNHEWSLPDISGLYISGVEQSYAQQRGKLTAGELFSLFLAGSHGKVREKTRSLDEFHVKALLESAQKGFTPAQAVVNRILVSYGIPTPTYIERKTIVQWLFEGASSGSQLSLSDLRNFDIALANEATKRFYEKDGYHQLYSSQLEQTLWRNWKCSLQTITESASDCYEVVEKVLNTTESDLGIDRHKLLYMACQAGCWQTVKLLCHHRANASIPSEPDGITCLHWLFNFPAEYIKDIAAVLVECGGNVDAVLIAANPVVNYHFPFTWPPGTPLHWAVAASNPMAVTALLNLGANANLRNQYDPYYDDLNVRYNDFWVGTRQGGHSVPTEQPGGFNMLDLAAANHAWIILEAVQQTSSKTFNVSLADEEGYTPIHRLEYNWIGRTIADGRYYYPAFAGSSSTRHEDILRTVKALQAIGGDINSLTKPSDSNQRKGDRPGSLTPVMLATARCDLDAVKALLLRGANPNRRNNHGFNALSVLPERRDPQVQPRNLAPVVRALLQYGADVRDVGQFKGWSPLVSAIHSDSLKAVEMVLRAGADPRQSYLGLDSRAMLLAQHSIDPYMVSRMGFERFVQHDNHLSRILEQQVLPLHCDESKDAFENVDGQGGSLIHFAARSGLAKVVIALISAGAKPNAFRVKRKDGPEALLGFDMGSGTPLDVVLERRYKTMKTLDGGHLSVPRPDYAIILKVLDEVEAVLLKNGGRYMRPIDIHVY